MTADLIPEKIKIRNGISRCFSRAAHQYDEACKVQKRVFERLYFEYFNKEEISERASSINQKFNTRFLDLGSGTGLALPYFQVDFPKVQIVQLDLALAQCEQASQKTTSQKPDSPLIICGDFDALPFASQSFDLVFSSLALQWSLDLNHSFQEISRILKPGGALVFSMVGEGSLKELERAKSFTQDSPSLIFPGFQPEKSVSPSRGETSSENANSLANPEKDSSPKKFARNLSLPQVENLLNQPQWEILLSEQKSEKFDYHSPLEVLKNIKAVGANYAMPSFSGLAGKKYTSSILGNYEQDPITKKYPLTYEIYYVVARKLR